MNKKLITGLVIMLLATGGTAFGLLMSQKVIPSTGIVVVVIPPPPPATIGIAVFSDAAGTVEVTSVSWGNLYPGDTGHMKLYLLNTGNTNGVVTVAPGNWNPAETKDIATLSWDSEGKAIGAGAMVEVNLALAVSGNVTGITTFAFDIIFTIEG